METLYKLGLALACAMTSDSYLQAVALYVRTLKLNVKLTTAVASQRPARQELA